MKQILCIFSMLLFVSCMYYIYRQFFFLELRKNINAISLGFFYGRGTILNFDWFSVTVAWFYGYKATLQEVARILEN